MLQRFEGKSIEDALAAAAAALGPDLQVTDAKRVREGGVLGFFAKERYEVIAEPGLYDWADDPGAALASTLVDSARMPAPPNTTVEEAASVSPRAPALPSAEAAVDAATAAVAALRDFPRPAAAPVLAPQPAAVTRPAPARRSALQTADPGERIDQALRALVDEVEAGERMTVTQTGAPTNGPTFAEALVAAQRFDLDDRLPLIDVDDDIVAAPPVPLAITLPAEPVITAPAVSVVAPPPARPGREPIWSRNALAGLGVPVEVLARLPIIDPDNDLEWTAALGRAIAAEVPAAGTLGPATRLSVSGYGLAAAVDLVRAGVQGFTPDALVIDSQPVPATATELALAIRSLLPR